MQTRSNESWLGWIRLRISSTWRFPPLDSPLKGVLKGFWAVSVSGIRRIIFRFGNGNSYDVDIVDYH